MFNPSAAFSRHRLTLALMLGIVGISSWQTTVADPRIRANNAAYFQDESFIKQNAHQVDSLAYGEALYLMHTDQDLGALVLLELQDQTQTAEQASLYSRLLQASIAAKQGLLTYANAALSKATENPDESTRYDLDRLYLFRSELAYQQKDRNLLAESLGNVRAPNQLPDPDALFYLRVQSAISADNIVAANNALGQMALSPWRAVSKINIALWHYRQQDFTAGIPILEETLSEIDESVQYSALDYWYARGRTHTEVMGSNESAEQQQELTLLSDRVLTLIAYGHLKQIIQPKQTATKREGIDVTTADFNATKVRAAQNAVFQIPQSSPFATQGLELLAESLFYAGGNSKGSLFESKTKFNARQLAEKENLNRILKRLSEPHQPVLTRLRSQFKQIKLNSDLSMNERSQLLTNTIEQVQDLIQVRDEFLLQPAENHQKLLDPFYKTKNIDDGFDITNVEWANIPLHQHQFIQWLSQPIIKNHLKTLRFFQESLKFIAEWNASMPLLLSQIDQTYAYGSTAIGAMRLVEQEYQQLENQFASLSAGLRPIIPTVKEQYYMKQSQQLMPVLQLITKRNDDIAAEMAQTQLDLIRLQQGQIRWQQITQSQLRAQSAQLLINQIEAARNDIKIQKNKLIQKPTISGFNAADILAFDRQIKSAEREVKQALQWNKNLFVSSLKNTISKEQQHLKAALVQLRLEQAALLQLAGDKSE